jgi:hypothetical protein
MARRWMGRSRLLAICGVLGVGVVGVAIPAGQASARPLPKWDHVASASSPFKYNSDTCGYGPSTDEIGTVVFTRTSIRTGSDTSTTLSITISLRGAPANSTFEMELFSYYCSDVETLGDVHVNATGEATAEFDVNVLPQMTDFFLAAPFWSETYNVSLPAPPVSPLHTSPIKYDADYCGLEPGSSIGTAIFTKTGSRLSIEVTMHGAPADASSPVWLFASTYTGREYCEPAAYLGYLTTNAHGNKYETFSVTLPTDVTSVFLDSYFGESNDVYVG